MLSITVGPISIKVKFKSGVISEFHASPLKINVWETLIQEGQGYSGNVTLASYHMWEIFISENALGTQLISSELNSFLLSPRRQVE